MLLKDDHEEKRRKSIKRERRKVREKGGKEAQMQMENIKMYKKTEKSEKTGKQKKFEREELLRIKHLSVTFTQYDGWFSRKTLPVIRDLSLSVSRGEMVAVVGSRLLPVLPLSSMGPDKKHSGEPGRSHGPSAF